MSPPGRSATFTNLGGVTPRGSVAVREGAGVAVGVRTATGLGVGVAVISAVGEGVAVGVVAGVGSGTRVDVASGAPQATSTRMLNTTMKGQRETVPMPRIISVSGLQGQIRSRTIVGGLSPSPVFPSSRLNVKSTAPNFPKGQIRQTATKECSPLDSNLITANQGSTAPRSRHRTRTISFQHEGIPYRGN